MSLAALLCCACLASSASGDDAASAGADDAVQIPAVTPVARTTSMNNWWMTRHESILAKIRSSGDSIRTVFLGDSITELWDAGIWNASFSSYGAINLGYTADTTGHVLWRIANGELDGYNAEKVVLLIGTNNIGNNGDKVRHVLRGIKAVVDAVRAKQPSAQILLHTIFPRGDSDEYERKIRLVNSALGEYANGTDIVLCDFHDRFLEADGSLKASLFKNDALHPVAAGYAVWRDCLLPVLDPQVYGPVPTAAAENPAEFETCADGEEAFRLADATVAYAESFETNALRTIGKTTAREFAEALSRTSGSDVKAFRERDMPKAAAPVVWIGDTDAARRAGIDVSGFGAGEYRIRVERDRAFIAARTAFATELGCNDFLERFADFYRMTVSGKDPFSVDPARQAKTCDFTSRPAFEHAEVSCGIRWHYPATVPNRLASYARRLGTVPSPEDDWVVSKRSWPCHSFYNYCRPEEWFGKRPDFYSMNREGKREARWNRGTELCFSASGLLDVVYASLEGFIAADQAEFPQNPPRIYEFSQMDNADSLCWCPECKETIARYNRKPGGHKEGGDAGLQLEFVNRLAKKLGKDHPGLFLRTFAYVSTEGTPLGIRPETNVIVRLCDLYSASDHMLPLEHPFNAARLALLRDWAAIAPNLEIWDYRLYSNNPCDGIFPEVNVDATAADLRLFARLGVKRLLIEHYFENQPFYELNAFVEAKLLRDPSRDPDELVRTYCRVYGKGAEKMLEAINLLRRETLANPPTGVGEWHYRILPWRNARTFDEFGRIVREAYRLEKPGSTERGRIAEALAGASLELARIYRTEPGAEKKFDAACKAARRLFAEGLAHGGVDPDDAKREADKFEHQVGRLSLRFKDLPPGLAGTPSGKLVCFDQSCAYIESLQNDKDIPDPLSETGTATKWRPLAEPEGGVPWLVWRGEVAGGAPAAFSPVADGAYHWYRLGTVKCSQPTLLYIPKGGSCYRMRDFCPPSADGKGTEFEVWVSARRVGEEIATQDKSRGLFTDRVVLRRL